MFFWRFWWISSKSGQVFLTWILQNLFLEPKIFPWLQCKIFTPEPFPGTNSFPMIAVQNFHSRTLSWNHIFSHDCSARFSLQNPFLEPKNFPWLQCKIFTPEPFPGTNSFPMIAVQNFHSRTLSWNPKKIPWLQCKIFTPEPFPGTKKFPMIAVSARFSLQNLFLEPTVFPWLQCKIFTPEPFPGTTFFPMIAVQNFYSRTFFLEPKFFPWLQCTIFIPEPFPGTKKNPMIVVQDFHSRTLSWNQQFSHDCSAKFSLQNPFLEPTVFPWLQCKIFTPEPFPGTKNFPMIAVQNFHSRTLSWNQKIPWLQCKIFTPEPFPGTQNFPMIAVQDFHSKTISWNQNVSHDCSAKFSLQNLFLEPNIFPWLQCKIFIPEPFPGTTFFPMIAVKLCPKTQSVHCHDTVTCSHMLSWTQDINGSMTQLSQLS